MRPGRRRARGSLPVGALLAQVLIVVAVVLVIGVFQQQTANDEKSREVSDRQTALDLREAELDQRRSALDQREDALDDRQTALTTGQAALEGDRAALDAADAALKTREQALADGTRSLSEDQAALQKAEAEFEARQKAFELKQADYDVRLGDYAALQQAVDDALRARTRVASRLKASFESAGVEADVDAEGSASVALDHLFAGSSASLTKGGMRLLDELLPLWYGASAGESVSALSVEVGAGASSSQALDLAGRRALAILSYARDCEALGETGRAAVQAAGLSGARAAQGELQAVFRFFLNNDALRAARAG